MTERELYSVQSSELLLQELYIDLRRKVRSWSAITHQTPQARMGYVGQHLTSVVTGYPGSRSGARGHDLVLPNGAYSEIKTCYRVDQLGQCLLCAARVSSIEYICPNCGGSSIGRKDDSKWLITIRNEEELGTLFDPQLYYLVLFDLTEAGSSDETPLAGNEESESLLITDRPLDINARIWQVHPKSPGFAWCMIDYYFNIQAVSKSKAPFNLWPYSLKFQLMRPLLIYHSVIRADDSVQTLLFPGQVGVPAVFALGTFHSMKGSRRNLTDAMLLQLAESRDVYIDRPNNRARILQLLQDAREAEKWDDDELASELVDLIYRDKTAEHDTWRP